MDLSFLISIGYMFLLISYIVTNIVWYRAINIVGCGFVVLWGCLTASGSNLIQIIVWNSLFAIIQIFNLIKLFCTLNPLGIKLASSQTELDTKNTIAKPMDEPQSVTHQEILVLG
jgi:hypothetical protein